MIAKPEKTEKNVFGREIYIMEKYIVFVQSFQFFRFFSFFLVLATKKNETPKKKTEKN